MYNIELINNEEVIKVFDDILIKQGKNQKFTTIAITNKRLLFLDYLLDNCIEESLRISHGIDYLRMKEIYYQINLKDVAKVFEDNLYVIVCKDDTTFEFEDEILYELLLNQLN